MLPELSNFGIQPPIYLRKIPSRAKWNTENCSSVQDRAEKIVNSVFKESIYSIWLINSDKDFYCVVASLSARRTPQYQDIDFIWITEEEIKELGIIKKQTMEGNCLYAQQLHYNIEMDSKLAIELCCKLIREEREPQRCKRKKMTKLILEYQKNFGCKAIKNDKEYCDCEKMFCEN